MAFPQTHPSYASACQQPSPGPCSACGLASSLQDTGCSLEPRQEAQEKLLPFRPAEPLVPEGTRPGTGLSTARALSNVPSSAPAGSPRGSGTERGLPRVLPQVHALAGGAAAGRHGQEPPRTAAEVGPSQDLARGPQAGNSHSDARHLGPEPPARPPTPAPRHPAGADRTLPLTRAEALQSTFLLMSPRQLYEHFRGDYQTHDIGWSEEQAGTVLQAWQRRFVQVRVEKGRAAPRGRAPAAPQTHPVSAAGPGGPA